MEPIRKFETGIPGVALRFAREADMPALLRLIRELSVYEKMESEVAATEEGLRASLFREGAAEAVLAERDGLPVGYALFFHNFSTFQGRKGFYLEDIFVVPRERGSGIGKALLAFLARLASERGCARMEWVCLDWNLPSARFYESFGARPLKDWTVFRLEGEALQKLAGESEGAPLSPEEPEQRAPSAREQPAGVKKVPLKDGRELLIRPAEESDAAAVIGYINAIGGESDFLTFGKNGCPNDLEQEKQSIRDMGERPNSIYLLGRIGGELACLANLRAEQKERLAHNCELGISVRKKYWHLGAASALLTELIGFAKANGTLRTIHLDVYGNNERAIRLYEKFGFRPAGRLKNYFQVRGSYYDDVVMDLYL